jgi:hypothetical protein
MLTSKLLALGGAKTKEAKRGHFLFLLLYYNALLLATVF